MRAQTHQVAVHRIPHHTIEMRVLGVIILYLTCIVSLSLAFSSKSLNVGNALRRFRHIPQSQTISARNTHKTSFQLYNSDGESGSEEFTNNLDGNTVITSRKIEKLTKEIKELEETLVSLKEVRAKDEEALKGLNQEYGSEIERIKREFARIKERSYEEARDLTMKAKVDAVKEILPVTDDYFRVKKIYDPFQTENEATIMGHYDEIFSNLTKILEEFGATRVLSVGQPFDYVFMEAIMTTPSNEYGPDIVTTEYQVGYKLGDKCIRPALVVVSTGPGPA